ncbi:MAG: hypothetical protein U1G08_10805 [Verrucomicrobiota bacterium]
MEYLRPESAGIIWNRSYGDESVYIENPSGDSVVIFVGLAAPPP